MLSLKKEDQLTLQKEVKLTLEKKNLDTLRANVVVVLDDSGSMGGEYSSGQVQNVADRLLALSAHWDPDQQIDVYTINHGKVGTMSVSNSDGWINKNIRASGGTMFAYTINAIVADMGNKQQQITTTTEKAKGIMGFFGKTETVTHVSSEERTPEVPTFVFFLTDGENFDHPETEKALRDASTHAIFFQFVGIGNEQFKFLQKLDDLTGRFLDNADFFHMEPTLDGPKLYGKILTEFPGWLKQARAKGLVA
jgi:uncharacterized protein YegL